MNVIYGGLRGASVTLQRVDYYWGLFDSPEAAGPSTAEQHYRFEAPDIPASLICSFSQERIGELSGEYGLADVGEPTEVDHLEFSSGGSTKVIRVLNRGISLFIAETEELKRLHRFFGVLRDCAEYPDDHTC